MPEWNPTSQRARELFLGLAVAGFTLALAPVSSALRPSHLTAHDVRETQSTQMGAMTSAPEHEAQLPQRMRQNEGMGTMLQLMVARSGQTTREHVCSTPETPDRDLRIVLAMMAVQQRRLARESSMSEAHSIGQAVAPPDAARWAEHRQSDPACSSIYS